jgi:hypothetical protein
MKEGRQATDAVSRDFGLAAVGIENQSGEFRNLVAGGRLIKDNPISPDTTASITDASGQSGQRDPRASSRIDTHNQEVISQCVELGEIH